MSEFNIHRGPIPNPLTVHPGQVILTASIYPDERSISTGGFHLSLTVEHPFLQGSAEKPTGGGNSINMLSTDPFSSVELADEFALAVAAKWQATDVYIETCTVRANRK
jgi:hypothetical protein